MSKVILVKDLVKRYKKANQNAVDGISFSVDAGEFFALLGPNGAGKTTIVSILTTLLSKTLGEATILGFDIDKNPSQVRQNIGIIFQKPSLDPNLTAEENIRFHACLYNLFPFRPFFGLMPKSYQNRVFELAEVLGIKKEIFQPIKTFSGGMMRKIEIVRGLMHHPKILFLDEPTTGLDPLSRKNLWEYLKQVRIKEGVTILLTTHYLEEAEDCDNICLINKGKIVAQGTPAGLKRNLVQEYLEIDAKNRTRLKRELDRLKFNYEEGILFKVPTGKLGLQKIISQIKTPLDTLKIHSPSLEDAYLAIISQSEGSDSENGSFNP